MPLPAVAEAKNGANITNGGGVQGATDAAGAVNNNNAEVAPPLQENLHPNHVLFRKVTLSI